MEIGEYLATLRKRWYVIVVLAVLGAGIGYQQAQASTPMYRSTAKVFVSLARGDTVADLVQGSAYAQPRQSYVQLTTVPAVLEPVIAKLDLPVTAKQLSVNVHAEAPLDTMLIEISATSRSAERASDVANAVADQLSQTVESLSPMSEDGVASVKITMVGEATPASFPFSPTPSCSWRRAVHSASRSASRSPWRGPGSTRRSGAPPTSRASPHDRFSGSSRTTGPSPPRGRGRSSSTHAGHSPRPTDGCAPTSTSSTRPTLCAPLVVTSTVPLRGQVDDVREPRARARRHRAAGCLLVDADLRRPRRRPASAGSRERSASRRSSSAQGDPRGRPSAVGSRGVSRRRDGRAGCRRTRPSSSTPSAIAGSFLEEAKASYDMVIVNTSPLLACQRRRRARPPHQRGDRGRTGPPRRWTGTTSRRP